MPNDLAIGRKELETFLLGLDEQELVEGIIVGYGGLELPCGVAHGPSSEVHLQMRYPIVTTHKTTL